VSVFVPVRDEERYVGPCLDGVLAQDYPRERFEVLVVDGASTDGTRAVVEQRAARSDVPVRVIDNPRRVIPAAMNRALDAARGDYLVRVDAHSVPEPSYVRCAVAANVEHGADLVGGWVQARGEGIVGRAIAAAFASPVSMGNPSSWRRPPGPIEVASAPCGSYRVEALRAIGGYDEEQLVNEDYEANYRLRAAGGRVMISPDVSFTYIPRRTLRALAVQFYRYGFFKARVMVKHPRSSRPRHFVPAAGLVGYALLLAAAPFVAAAAWAALALAVLYVLGTVAAALRARDAGRAALLLPLVLPTMHLAWAAGNVAGLARWLPRRRAVTASLPPRTAEAA
jgi:glycosyltransferase involved in cell wall biosynthesis